MHLLRGKQTEADCKERKATPRPGNFAAKLPRDPGVDRASREVLPVPAKGNLLRETAPLMSMALLFYCFKNGVGDGAVHGCVPWAFSAFTSRGAWGRGIFMSRRMRLCDF
ncbi:trans-sialidase [Trypanosoma cruzi]|nr:trans-sialidase [Trypanosoma cruzi]